MIYIIYGDFTITCTKNKEVFYEKVQFSATMHTKPHSWIYICTICYSGLVGNVKCREAQ